MARPTLRRGASGRHVEVLQYYLCRNNNTILGLSPEFIDGDFGPLTESRVIEFQTDHSLVVDGIVGSQTWGALAFRPVPPTLRRGSRNATVAKLQLALRDDAPGLYAAAIDGAFGPLTETGVRQVQQNNGVFVDGIVGFTTWCVDIGVASISVAGACDF